MSWPHHQPTQSEPGAPVFPTSSPPRGGGAGGPAGDGLVPGFLIPSRAGAAGRPARRCAPIPQPSPHSAAEATERAP